MKSKARQLIEAPIDVGDLPDYIDRGKHRKFDTGQHAYANLKGFPQRHTSALASRQYQGLIRKLERYLGRRLRPGQQNGMQVIMAGMQALQQAIQLEQGHERELEQLAVNTVLDMPEFAGAREAVDAGELKIKAELRPEIELGGAQLEPEENELPDMDIPEIEQEISSETDKRKMINLMIQGNAMMKSYAFHLVGDQINQISPQLSNLYGVLTAAGELGQWMMPDEMQMAAMGGGQGAGGSEKIYQEDGVPVVHAQAITFPILLQELVKGLMEYVSYDEDMDPETRKSVYGKTDVLKDEPYALMIGPQVWQNIVNLVPADKQNLLQRVYDHITHLPSDQFNDLLREIHGGTTRAKEAVDELLASIEGEMDESVKVMRKMLDD